MPDYARTTDRFSDSRYPEFLQIRQGGIPGSKIIERHLNAGIPQHLETPDVLDTRIHQQTFGDFNGNRIARQPQLTHLRQPMTKLARALIAKLHRRLVDADLESRQISMAPLFQLSCRLAKHPIAISIIRPTSSATGIKFTGLIKPCSDAASVSALRPCAHRPSSNLQ